MASYNCIKHNRNTYSLSVMGDIALASHIYKFIQQFINNANIDYDNNRVLFCAENVMTLKTKIIEQRQFSYNKCIKLIEDLTTQLTQLKQLGYGFYGIDIDDILVINDNFIFCSSKYILPIFKETMFLTAPPDKPYFGNPEINQISVLPAEIHYKCVYYSLGCLVVFCLLNKYLLVGNEIKSQQEIEKILYPIHNTKIYWFIQRCLDDNVNKRRILLI